MKEIEENPNRKVLFQGREIVLGVTKIRCICAAKSNRDRHYNQFVVGEYYTVADILVNNELIKTSEGYRLTYISTALYEKEFEFVDDNEKLISDMFLI